ncbi:MAG: hypothetical protein AAFP84_09255 [Actinomycetota bacterium]
MMLVRLAATDFADRVTVIPTPAPHGLDAVGQRVDGVVAAHMLGHLDLNARRAFIEWIAARLPDDGVALLTVSGDAAPSPDIVAVEEAQVGRHIYRATHHSPDAHTYESLFEVCDGDAVLRSRVVTGTWHRVTADEIRSSAEPHGLRVVEPRPGVVLLRRR